MIRDRLARSMRREQLEPIPTVGRPVDPALMLVTSVVADADAAPGTVVHELRRGYTFRGRLLRCAEVQAAAARSDSTF
jgi:molecular chaperone GrpE